MSLLLPPTITVRFGGWQRTFAPGADVVIGRDVRADVRMPHPGVSGSRAVALPRRSLGRDRQQEQERNLPCGTAGVFRGLRNGQILHIGDPDGPWLTFELGPPIKQDADASNIATTVLPAQQPASEDEPSTTRIGRGFDNDVVIPARWRRATTRRWWTPGGVRIQDADSANGTFVNGHRVDNAALETERRRHDRQRRLRVRERQSRPSHRTSRFDRWPRGV